MTDKIRPFVFSCDAHVAEPPDLFVKAMPDSLKQFAIHSEADGDVRITRIGDQVILKINTNFHAHKTGEGDAAFNAQAGDRSCIDAKDNFVSDCAVDTKRRGARDLELRLADMDRDGVDAELVFPSLGLMLPRIADREGQRVACRIWNDWAWDYTAPVRDRLIPAAMIPCIDFEDALAECRRTADKGFAAFCLWEGLNNYNDSRWDPIFALAADQGIPLVFHTGVGDINIRALKGPGGALYNYTRQMNDAVDVITQLVAGGVLDRNPGAHILFAEHSAGWLWGLAERMDEVYNGHAPSISPKLSRLPSQIVRDQVHLALQNDGNSSMAIRRGVGIEALLFATDYPHAEGTFPFSKQVIDKLSADNPDVTSDELVAVLGGNAARLFRRANLGAKVEARKAELVSAA
ncbi:putative TIM-barrel fold metal-dependent hydrolase [Novosphingobium kunmingense]|uniref:Putative TIM-barrel fold metal-dependent hydrolase n=1 Tax=Novosphingobium kunmingense TaxID=1211806 RepID=A0A2N0H5X7_9SPHN|nr:amidohydrolase family protein [Novosphingobium kunmingense]PKB14345.1 putative TIM-barrel fold metal-dependent hydrolase [Novosphingobium kunmingense]